MQWKHIWTRCCSAVVLIAWHLQLVVERPACGFGAALMLRLLSAGM